MGTVHAKEEKILSSTRIAEELQGLERHEINYDTCDVPGKDINLEGVRARVDRVHIEGLGRTKNDIVEDAIKDLFTACDFQDVLIKAHKVRMKLDSLGCFRNIAVFIDTSKGPKATPDGVEVTYHVKEFRALTGGVNTHVGNNEGSLIIGMRAPNLFGRGERLQCEYSYGSKRSNNFNVSFVKPFRGSHSPVLTATVFQARTEFPPSGYATLDKGVLLDYGFTSLPWPLKHNIQWEGVIRELGVLTRTSSFDVREDSGHTLKSAIKHIVSSDQRDDPIFPSCGKYYQLMTEFAGVGGNVGFIKNEGYLQSNYNLFSDIVLQGTFMLGHMIPFGSEKKLGLADQFYLGGPLTLRGFKMRGCGPISDGDTLGSMSYFSAGLHLYGPLPFRPGKGGFGELFRTHAFVNIGNVSDLTDDEKSIINHLAENFRIAYGIGIAIRLGQMARVEVNYCVPHRYEDSDKIQPGVQFGVGVHFV